MKQLSLLLLLFLMTGCASDSKTRLIRLGHGLDVTHSVHQAMEIKVESGEVELISTLKLEDCQTALNYPLRTFIVDEVCYTFYRLGYCVS